MRSSTRDPLPEWELRSLGEGGDCNPKSFMGARLLVKGRAIPAAWRAKICAVGSKLPSTLFKSAARVTNTGSLRRFLLVLYFPFISKDTLKLFHSEVNVCLFLSERKQIHGVVLL